MFACVCARARGRLGKRTSRHVGAYVPASLLNFEKVFFKKKLPK